MTNGANHSQSIVKAAEQRLHPAMVRYSLCQRASAYQSPPRIPARAAGRQRKLLRLWQAAAFMAAAALLLSLIACTGKATRADARTWSAYAKATSQIMQNQEGK